MKRKIFTFLLCGLMGTMVMAQTTRTGGIIKTATPPVVDSVIDDVWATANTYPIDLPFQKETPTLGEPGQTTWKALWTDDGVYILVTVTDDYFYPGYKNNDAGTDWKYDKPEIYFDVNAEKKDGIGGGGGKGHYQVAPGFGDGSKNDGTPTTGTDGVIVAFKVTEPNYVGEYFIPFTKLVDKDGNDVDKSISMGFDVTVIDGDPAAPGVRQRAVWTNIGAINESYNNMDDCGLVTFDPIPLTGNVIKKAASAPVIDGVIDPIWSSANVFNIDKPFQKETPTLGEPGQTTWKALWNDDGMFILVTVTDDDFFPGYKNNDAGTDWKYDKPELYFDCNAVKKDGVGGGGGKGHYQVAPGFGDGSKNDGTPTTGTDGVIDALKVTGTNYVGEYFIPWTKLVDAAGVDFDKASPMGFDVTVIDGDSNAPGVRQRAVWSNVGAINESYNNMDDCAEIVFEGTQEAVYVDVVTVKAGSITADNGTLQMTYTIAPSNATNKKVKWSVENGTGQARISADGLLSALSNGTVTVKAAARDGGYAEGTAVVTISGQVVSKDDIWNSFNLVKNWNFEGGKTGDFPTSWGGWIDIGGMAAGAAVPAIEDGVCVQRVGLANDGANYHYQLNQNALAGEPNVPYTFKFKTWASADNTPCVVDFEDTSGNSYTRYGATTDPQSGDGRSEWHYAANIQPTWYTFHVVFDKILSNTDQKVQWMNSLSNETIYLDSVLIIKDADLLSSAQVIAANTMKVYPNPVGSASELTVSLTSLNARVSLYNSLGQKLMEKTANGNIAKFNVSSLNKGMYFIRLDNGTTQKFVR